MKEKFSIDPKIKLVTIETFIKDNHFLYFDSIPILSNKKPSPGVYFKFTPTYLIKITFRPTMKLFGTIPSEVLDEIQVAIRDGITEYKVFDDKIKEAISASNENNFEDYQIKEMQEHMVRIKRIFPGYVERKENSQFDIFTSFLKSVKKDPESLALDNYVVLDVETNGIRTKYDDLLSISFYSPKTGLCYNRYLPLDLQPLVLTSYIHNINDKDLKKATHLTQKEVDWLLSTFDLKDATILTYSGGKGTFDSTFLINYCKRHDLFGFEGLNYVNIKSFIPSSGIRLSGQLTKDALCKLFNVSGVTNIHTSMNDCFLEWELFKKLKYGKYFFIENDMFQFNSDYIIPITHLNDCPELSDYANIKIPSLTATPTEIFKYAFPKKVLSKIKKFPINITGITVENAINSLLNAKKEDNSAFLLNNRSKLKYIGSIESRIKTINVATSPDGLLIAVNKEDQRYIDDVNKVTVIIKEYLSSTIDFIKTNIFDDENIKSQELVLSNNNKVLALCDLSSQSKILEIKTIEVLDYDGLVKDKIAKQIYCESKNRASYLLELQFENAKYNLTPPTNVFITIYKVDIEEKERIIQTITAELTRTQIKILNMLQHDPTSTNKSLCHFLKIMPNDLSKMLKMLQDLGYIKRKTNKRNSPWIVLKTDKTYTYTPKKLN